MSEQNTPETRTEEPELNDEALEQVAGGCEWGDSMTGNNTLTISTISTVSTVATIPTLSGTSSN